MASNTNIQQLSSAADKIKAVSSYDSSNSAVSYDPNVDYQARINAAVAAGDMTSAAAAERQRNAKIDATGSTQQKTNNYSQYLSSGTQNSGSTYYDKNTDYQAEINKATAAGDMQTAALLERQRNAKIQGEGMTNQQQTSEYAAYNPSSSKTYNGTSYNSNLDYMAGMLQAAQNGDLETARQLEQTRNAKIDGDGLDFEKTNLFGTQEKTTEQPTTSTTTPTTTTTPQQVYISSGSSSSSSSGSSGDGYRYSDILANPNDLVSTMIDQLNSWREAAAQQSQLKRDYAVEQGVNELQRALEDAQQQFQTQRDQVSKDERKALDNSALYAEARGDRGGIGQEQYNLIQSSAAQNRLAVSQAQTKLSTDTARQIADLRAQGEFSKADDLLSLAQTYLSQLTQLQQWGADYALDYASFQESIRQWEAEYELQKAQIMGSLNGESTLAAKQYETSKQQWQDEFNWSKYTWQNEFDQSNKQWQSEYDLSRDKYNTSNQQWQAEYDLSKSKLDTSNQQWQSEFGQSQTEWNAQLGKSLLSAGIMPSEVQLQAMGITKAQATQYISALNAASSNNSGSGGGSGTTATGSKTSNTGKTGGTGNTDTSTATGDSKTGSTQKSNADLYNAAVTAARSQGRSDVMPLTYEVWVRTKDRPDTTDLVAKYADSYEDYINTLIEFVYANRGSTR